MKYIEVNKGNSKIKVMIKSKTEGKNAKTIYGIIRIQVLPTTKVQWNYRCSAVTIEIRQLQTQNIYYIISISL